MVTFGFGFIKKPLLLRSGDHPKVYVKKHVNRIAV
jgi:hypothetical protein